MMDTTMKKSKFVTYLVAILASGFTVSSALADEGVIRVKAGLGFASYSAPYGNNEITTNYTTQGAGVTYIWPSSVFVDLATKSSTQNSSYNAKNVFGGLVTSDQPFARTENTLTVGKSIENSIQLNTGIFTADTVFNLAQYGQFSQKMVGLTAGAGKGFLIDEGRAGSIGVSGTVALLNAKNSDRFGVVTNSNLSYGLSLGAVYNYAITKNISVLADGKFQTYLITYPGFSGDERILSSSLSLLAQF